MRKGRGYPWSENEIEVLKANAGKLSSTKIGKLLGRTQQAVQMRALRLGISLDGYSKQMPCIDCGTIIHVPWQATNKETRCEVCRIKHQKIYNQEHQSNVLRQNYDGNREAVFERDSYRCRLCGSIQNLIIHHINEISYHNTDHPDNDLDNLTTLCKSCHAHYHAKKNRSGKTELGVAI